MSRQIEEGTMETIALTGITAHCGTENRYWWIIPALLILAIVVRGIYRRISDARDDRRADRRFADACRATRLDDQDRFRGGHA